MNERIERVSDALQVVPHRGLAIVCECGSETCIDQISLSFAEYEHVRGDPRTFIVRPGHEEPEVETVVERSEGYYVVRKATPAAIDYAEEADERT